DVAEVCEQLDSIAILDPDRPIDDAYAAEGSEFGVSSRARILEEEFQRSIERHGDISIVTNLPQSAAVDPYMLSLCRLERFALGYEERFRTNRAVVVAERGFESGG